MNNFIKTMDWGSFGIVSFGLGVYYYYSGDLASQILACHGSLMAMFFYSLVQLSKRDINEKAKP